MAENVNKSPAVLVLAAWIFVGVPLGWGVFQVVKTASKLFNAPPPSTQTAPAKSAPSTTTTANPK